MTFGSFRLSTRMALIQALTVVATAVICAGLIFSRLNGVLIDTSVTALEHAIEVRGTRFSTRIDEMVHDVLLMATVPPIQGLIRADRNGGTDPVDGSTSALWRERLETIYRSVIRHKPNYLQVRFIGVADDGRELIRVERAEHGELRAVHGDALQRKGHRAYFNESIAKPPGGVFLSPINFNREYDAIQVPHVPVIRAGTPVFSADGELFGAVVINMAIADVLDEMANSEGTGRRYFITNEQGQYLHHPDPGRAFAFEFGDTTTARDDFAVVRRIVDGEANRGAFVDDAERRVMAAQRIDYGPPGGGNWLAVIGRDGFGDVTAIADQVLEQVILLIMVLGVAAAVLGLWLSRRLARPIERLAEAVRNMDLERACLQVPSGLTAEADELSQALTNSVAALRRRTDELESRNREIERFAYMASHDLQAPLRHIKFFVTALKEDYSENLPDAAHDDLGKLMGAVGRLHDRIDALLRFSRVQRAPIDWSSLNLNEVLGQVLSDLDVDIAQANAQVVYEDLPTVCADAVLLPLVLQNLIENALRYCGSSDPVIRVTGAVEGSTAIVEVSDNGKGFDPQFNERIFMAFERLKNDAQGTGIGLAICRLIMAKHDGTIVAAGRPDDGATFTLRWPQRQL